MPKNTVLAVDDDWPFCGLLRASLEREGYQVLIANTTEEGVSAIRQEPVDIILLDVRVPNAGGLEFCRWVRGSSEKRDLPVLMMSVLGSEDDRVNGLNAGADDYLCKPFSGAVLAARLHALLRRSGALEIPSQAGELTLDWQARRTTVRGIEIRLTPKELDILTVFVKHTGKLQTRRALCETVWGPGQVTTYDRVDKYIRILREKLGPCASYIQTVWGLGYRFIPRKQHKNKIK